MNRALGIDRRDQAKVVVEHADQVVEVPAGRRILRASRNSSIDRIRPLISASVSGSSDFKTAWAAFW